MERTEEFFSNVHSNMLILTVVYYLIQTFHHAFVKCNHATVFEKKRKKTLILF